VTGVQRDGLAKPPLDAGLTGFLGARKIRTHASRRPAITQANPLYFIQNVIIDNQ